MSNPVKYLFGDTKTFTWVSSGQTPSPISVGIINGDEGVVNSSTMTSSGNGHFYKALTLPNTPGFYAVEYKATINALPFKERNVFQLTKGSTD